MVEPAGRSTDAVRREIVFFRTVSPLLTVAVDSEGHVGIIPAPSDSAFFPVPDPETFKIVLDMCTKYVQTKGDLDAVWAVPEARTDPAVMTEDAESGDAVPRIEIERLSRFGWYIELLDQTTIILDGAERLLPPTVRKDATALTEKGAIRKGDRILKQYKRKKELGKNKIILT